MLKRLCLSCLLIMLCQCKKKTSDDPRPNGPEIEDLDAKDGVASGEKQAEVTNRYVFIPSQQLEKDYIFQASMTFQSPAPEFSSVKSRIVRFQRDSDSLLMLESGEGNTIAKDPQKGILLAKFPIKETDSEGIKFDFNQGMSQLFLMGDLYAEDIQGKDFNAGDRWSTLEFSESWVSHVSADNGYEGYQITQKGQLKTQDQGGLNRLFPVTVDYSLKRYKPNPGFRPVRSFAKNHVGFFEISPQLRQGGGDTILYSSKFHINESKKIIYEISKNTPSEYIDAIKHGVFYWNRVFGKEVLQVVEQDQANMDYNLIQWVDWKNASYAYADMSMDPRSGEIIRAKVFLTSAFAFDAKIQARMFLTGLEDSDPFAFRFSSLAGFDYGKLKNPDQFDEMQQKISSDLKSLFAGGSAYETDNQSRGMAIKGFSPVKYCSLHYGAKRFSHYVNASEHASLSKQQILRVSQDMITAVVAHEVGHNLGLRHNFAGSLETKYQSEEFASEYEAYANGDKDFSKALTSTVMDYLSFKNSSALGSYIRKGGAALNYDKKAIDVLYNNRSLDDGVKTHFCTDTHLGLYVDCDVFDAGDSVFSRTKWEEKKAIDGLPVLLAELFKTAKFPPDGFEPSPLSQIALSAEQFAVMIVWNRFKLLQALSDEAKYLVIRSQYPGISDTNLEKVKSAEKGYVEAAFPDSRLLEYFESFQNSAILLGYSKFERIFNASYRKTAVDGKVQEFTEGEVSLILNKVKDLYEKLPHALALWDLGVLIFPQVFADIKAINEDLPGIIGKKMTYILTKTRSEIFDGKVKLNATNSEKSISVPVYQFPTDVRFAAVFGLANHQVRENLLWGVRKNQEINKLIFEALNDHAFGLEQARSLHGENILEHSYEDWSNSESAELQRKIRNWVVENQAILLNMKNLGPLY